MTILRSILPTITLMSTQMDIPANGRNYLSANAIKVSELHNLERNYYNHSNYKCKEPEKKYKSTTTMWLAGKEATCHLKWKV